MSASKSNTQLVAAFSADFDIYDRMSRAVADLLSQMISGEGLIVHSITHRCKTIESFSNKVSKPDKYYQALGDITDLAGIRITTYFSNDVDRIARIIRQEFLIDEANSVDKRKVLDPDRFGYQSLHFVAQIDDNRSRLLEYKKFSGKKFEIQIRSILQHAWAEIEHDLGYKSATAVPKEVRRRFARIAGLLEIADDEFDALRFELRRYEREVGQRVVSDSNEVGLNLPSLKAAYSKKLLIAELDKAIADKVGARLDSQVVDSLERAVRRLNYLGIEKISQLERAAKDNFELVPKFAELWIKSKREYIPLGIGVFYLAYVLLAIKGDKDAFIDYLNKFSIGLKSERDELAVRAIFLVSDIKKSLP